MLAETLMPGTVIVVDGVPRVITSCIPSTYRGVTTHYVAHVDPADYDDCVARVNRATVTVYADGIDVPTLPTH